mmetsp:Transcript_5827/g.15162  ORF Transcript_5827/g.15162 Transcript_5827/m.15162 type:complete len:190 (-) Transcript_5827:60-629(-)
MPTTHCEEYCRTTFSFEYCQVLEVSGVDGDWPVEVRDINNNFRLETERGIPILRNGRPSYRSIPARRGRGNAAKLDYFIYSTEARGFTEWLIDRNDLEADGAAGFFASASYLPQSLNTDWVFWREGPPLPSWTTTRLSIVCKDDLLAFQTSAAARAVVARGAGSDVCAWRAIATAALVMATTVVRGRSY